MLKITFLTYTFLPFIVSSKDHCDLNNDECFLKANKSGWTFNYPATKQEYIEEISQGKSWLTNPYREGGGLAKIEGVKVGYVQTCDFDDGRTVDVITRSMRPSLFEIPHFLTDEECDHIIKRAIDPKEGGMFTSQAKGGLTPVDNFKPSGKKGKAAGVFGEFLRWDKNEDREITMHEIIHMIHFRKGLIYKAEDVKEMFKDLEMSYLLEDDVIHEAEFETMNTLGLEEHIGIMYRTHPRFKQRTSEQAWLFMEQWIDPAVHKIRERLVKLSGLPREIIYGGEMLQVVHYNPFGHYHAHMDSETHERPGIPCCHQYEGSIMNTVGECKLCRYLTFVMYLNDVEEGGETAFPLADGKLLTDEEIRGNSTTDKYNLSHGCKRANLVVKPKKGTAVLWYNHHINETDGWMGEMDPFGLHGGCDVIKGEKWLSNMWIPAPYGRSKHKPSLYLNWKDLFLAEKGARGKSQF